MITKVKQLFIGDRSRKNIAQSGMINSLIDELKTFDIKLSIPLFLKEIFLFLQGLLT